MLSALACPTPFALGEPLWIEELLLLALAWLGLRLWWHQRPSFFLFAPSIYAAVIATLLFTMQLARDFDPVAVQFVFCVCAGLNLLIYGLMMRAELRRVVTCVFPRARIYRERRR
jgi:hypothetical protein